MRQKAALLSDRAVVRITGMDAGKLLAGLITNSLPKDGSGTFAGLLSPQGKILFDFFIVPHDSGFLVDISSVLVSDFIKRLTFYKLRADATLTDESAEYRVFAIWGGEDDPGEIVFRDPRYEALGFRSISSSGNIADFASRYESVDLQEYTRHRISLGIPEGGPDYVYGDSFPHDACYDFLNGVDFKKGCYIGQEVVSRMKHRGTARKRIVQVEAEQDLPLTGSDIISDGQTIGRTGSVAGRQGLALVRLDRAAKAISAGQPVTSGGVVLKPRVPSWAGYRIDKEDLTDGED